MFFFTCFLLVVSEDVLEEMPVNGGEEGVQMALLQQGGSVTPVDVSVILSGLTEGRLEPTIPTHFIQYVHASKNTEVCRCKRSLSYLFFVLLQSLLLLYNISERIVLARHVPVVHEWHLITGLWLAVQRHVTICTNQERCWLCLVSLPRFSYVWLTPVH